MDDLELMKKYYFEKEKENLRLKEELNQYKTKLTKNESSSLTQRQDYNTQPVTMENLEDDNDFFKESLKNPDANFHNSELNTRKLSTLKISSNRVQLLL